MACDERGRGEEVVVGQGCCAVVVVAAPLQAATAYRWWLRWSQPQALVLPWT